MNEAGNISQAEDLNVEPNILEFIMAASKGVVNRVIIGGVRLNIKHEIIYSEFFTSMTETSWDFSNVQNGVFYCYIGRFKSETRTYFVMFWIKSHNKEDLAFTDCMQS